MNAAISRRPVLLSLGILILVVAIVAILKRDTIADLLLRWGDTTLTDEAARDSPQAKIAMDFLGAFRASDMDAIARLVTPEQLARIQRETAQPSAEFQEIRTMMLDDLPAEPVVLRSKIKTVQVHANRAVVLAETQANSWFVQLELVDGSWKVMGF